MGGIWWFWFQIWNLLEIWTQKTYRTTYVVSFLVNLILKLEYQNICNKSNRSDMKIPSSDHESAHQIGQIIYSSCHLEEKTWPPPGVSNWFAYSMGYRSAMKISGPDSESPQKTSLDTSQTIPFRGCHPSLISATITDLAILRVIVRILCFSVQIWILLKKPVQTQVKPFHSEEVSQPSFQPPSLI